MKVLLASLLAVSATAFTPSSFNGASVSQRVATKASMSMETSEDLAVLAKKCNPVLGFFDPMGLAGQSFWDTTPEATIGFLREAEVKVINVLSVRLRIPSFVPPSYPFVVSLLYGILLAW
jgi:hypothetical protein